MHEKIPFEKFKNKAVFITGFPKSGTTLLQSLLDYHPQLVVVPEDLKYVRIAYTDRIKGEQTSMKKQLAMLFNEDIPNKFDINFLDNKSFAHPNGPKSTRDYSDIDFVKFKNKVSKRVNNASCNKEVILSLIESFYDVEHSDKSDKKAWVEKTTHNYNYFPILKEWFGDNVVCIHIERDPYDNFVSYRKSYQDKYVHKVDIKSFCMNWAYAKKLSLLAGKSIKNHHIIKYEDLVLKPEETMKKVCSYIGIDFNKGMLTPTLNGKDWHGNSMHGNYFNSVSSDTIGRYKTLLSADEIKKIKNKLFGFDLLFRLKLFLKVLNFKMKWRLATLRKKS